MDNAAAGLIGALIGSGASLLGLYIQQCFQTKRDRMKVAAELGLSEYKRDLDLAKDAGGGKVAPVSVYVYYHFRIFEEMSKGKVNAEKIKSLTAERDELLAGFPDPE